ncbi:glycosyltransferase family 1 protein [Zopfia rhizophila CBS 207.26]|uniref:Glycosyltransferase family 1 protein n=1 Tax=Zopfia rhizophila CBS 207.26 TaxID=1314779 RepID=A0A6A6DPI2_9PEZI|nr:glycosyltransferase family 1 protein [Zopfia rhizophila CBS 207.26]
MYNDEKQNHHRGREHLPAGDSASSPHEELMSDGTTTRADGRVDINLESRAVKRFSKLFPIPPQSPPRYSDIDHIYNDTQQAKPWSLPLNIVIQIVGSRGDVQPFIAFGNELQKFGHRVRLATHNVFGDFVRTSGLEFFPIGGDPSDLMAYMVKNPGLIPNISTIRRGDIQRKRSMISEMLTGCWNSCIEPDPFTKIPFVADAIVANPPSFAHIHCAQALGVPLHLMFTMPWSSTRAFPHPLANLHNAGTDVELANYLSYGIVEWMTWQGLGDIINKWRKSLGLEAVPQTEAPVLAEALKIPFTYCWSPALVPKPFDWPAHINVCGFFFRQNPPYTAHDALVTFLCQGPIPIYIGFGSIVIGDPAELTKILLEAVRTAGVRAIISRGWSKIGGPSNTNDVFYIDDCPHEWLFQKFAAVVHHGGAGTTACGLLNGLPTIVVPFFGDQPFWGHMVAAAGAGPKPIPFKQLNSQNLHDAISFCLNPKASAAAQGLAERIRTENGVSTAVDAFHRNLPGYQFYCDLIPDRPASWIYTKARARLKISKLAAAILVEHPKIERKHLKPLIKNPIFIENRRWDPVTAGTSSLMGTTVDMVTAAAGIFIDPVKAVKQASQSGDGVVSQAGVALAASAKNVGKVNGKFFKGTMLDLPFAVTEGLRAAPRLYGEDVKDHEPVTGWKSGARTAATSFAEGMIGGVSDILMQPYKGSKEGLLGFGKGLGKGSIGFATKTTSGLMGLVTYPGQGIYRSIYTATHSATQKRIVIALIEEGEYLERNWKTECIKDREVLDRFDVIRHQISKASSSSSLSERVG